VIGLNRVATLLRTELSREKYGHWNYRRSVQLQ
jgi:hypothetical protein